MSSDRDSVVVADDDGAFEEQSTSTRSWFAQKLEGVRRRLPQMPRNASEVDLSAEQTESVCFIEGICSGMLMGAGAGALVHYQWKKAWCTKVVGLVTMWIFAFGAFTSCRAPKLARLMREKAEREKRALRASGYDG
uniref:Cytochrome c oxidase assembly protein COX20, mitochondrial n=1 Tax=Plectus sambesii TaxID=2011161 RepID=A0A914VDJ7_9BILA